MSRPQRLACFAIEAWARLYTLGLTPACREARIDLIRADLYDELQDAGERPSAAGLFGRCVRGVPDDLAWRVFEARGLAAGGSIEGGRPVVPRTSSLPVLAIGAVLASTGAFGVALQPVAHSLSYAGALLTLLALGAWTLEARGAPDDEAPPTAWPLLLAVGIVAVAGGIVFAGGRLGLLVLLPLAAGCLVASLRATPGLRRPSAPAVPIPAIDLARHAAAGDAIAIERRSAGGVSRRALLRGGFGMGLASVLAAMGGIVVDFLWQRNVAGFGGIVTAGLAADFPPGSKTIVREGKFWLVNLTAEQGGPGYLALWQKCPHLGCVVPWSPNFRFPDPQTGDRTEGWFRCPCHQSTYNHAGVRVYGPAPRSMDRMALTIDADGLIQVDTGDISKGTDDNATFAVKP